MGRPAIAHDYNTTAEGSCNIIILMYTFRCSCLEYESSFWWHWADLAGWSQLYWIRVQSL